MKKITLILSTMLFLTSCEMFTDRLEIYAIDNLKYGMTDDQCRKQENVNVETKVDSTFSKNFATKIYSMDLGEKPYNNEYDSNNTTIYFTKEKKLFMVSYFIYINEPSSESSKKFNNLQKSIEDVWGECKNKKEVTLGNGIPMEMKLYSKGKMELLMMSTIEEVHSMGTTFEDMELNINNTDVSGISFKNTFKQ